MALSFYRWSCRFVRPWFCRELSLREKEARRIIEFSACQQPRWGSMVSQKNFTKSRNDHLMSLGLLAPRNLRSEKWVSMRFRKIHHYIRKRAFQENASWCCYPMKCKKSALRLLGTSVGEIDMILTMEQVFLTENPRGKYNQQGLYYAYSWQHP